MDAFIERFNRLARWSHVEKPSKLVIGQLLSALYCDPKRSYHNQEHILFCLDRLDEMKGCAMDYSLVAIALLFHDAIYNTKSDRNESDSASLFLMSSSERYNFADTQKITTLIMGTRHLPYPLPCDNDSKLIRDIDLCILGYPWEIFSRIGPKIRQEYSWVPDQLFKKHRIKFLNGLKKRQRIFLTDAFFDLYEKQARDNIAREIKELGKAQ